MSGNDALVIGAGVAGLAAAAALCEAGLHVTVLEARDRIGGRVHTLRDPGLGAVELGAEFVHGRPRDLLALLETAGAPVQTIEGAWMWDGERGLEPLSLRRELEPVLRRLREDEGPDRPFDAFLRGLQPPPDARTAALALGYVEGFHAAEPDRVSTAGLRHLETAAEAEGGDAPSRVPAGLDRAVQALRGSAELRLRTWVREVRWRAGTVTADATTADGKPLPSLRASRAVITVPLGVLGALRFAPELPDVRAAVARLAMGSVVKVVLLLREPLWESAGVPDLAFLVSRRPHFPTWWTLSPGKEPAIVGWAGGPAAARLTGRPTDALAAIAVEELAGLLRLPSDRVRQAVAGAHVADWGADPLARGAYSWEPMGAGDARAVLGQPVRGTLFFAGEATSTDGRAATLQGALASGTRAAIELLATL